MVPFSIARAYHSIISNTKIKIQQYIQHAVWSQRAWSARLHARPFAPAPHHLTSDRHTYANTYATRLARSSSTPRLRHYTAPAASLGFLVLLRLLEAQPAPVGQLVAQRLADGAEDPLGRVGVDGELIDQHDHA